MFLWVMTSVLSTHVRPHSWCRCCEAWHTHNAAAGTTTFAAIGLGMALPYLVLSAFPAFVPTALSQTVRRVNLISSKRMDGALLLAAAPIFLAPPAAWFRNTTPPA